MKYKLLQGLTASLALLGILACATIVGKPMQVVPISSTPSEADLVVKDETGAEVFRGKTPATVNLAKSTGKYFGGKTFTVSLSKGGFESQTLQITHKPTGWYLFGNILSGGLFGWLVLDPWTGKMYKLNPEQVSGTLQATGGSISAKASAETLPILLKTEVPLSLQGKLVLIEPQP